MDREKATGLLSGAVGAPDEVWTYLEELDAHGEPEYWEICPDRDRDEYESVCSSYEPPTPEVGRLLAAAPVLARWGIARDEECERLRAEVEKLQAERTTLLAQRDTLLFITQNYREPPAEGTTATQMAKAKVMDMVTADYLRRIYGVKEE